MAKLVLLRAYISSDDTLLAPKTTVTHHIYSCSWSFIQSFIKLTIHIHI